MRRRLLLTAVAMVVTLSLSSCVPVRSDVVGTWAASDGGTIEFHDDGTFVSSGIPAGVLYDDLLPEGAFEADFVDGMGGRWEIASYLDEQFPDGYAIRLYWDTPPIDWILDDLWGTVADGEATLSFVDGGYDDPLPVYDFHRTDP